MIRIRLDRGRANSDVDSTESLEEAQARELSDTLDSLLVVRCAVGVAMPA